MPWYLCAVAFVLWDSRNENRTNWRAHCWLAGWILFSTAFEVTAFEVNVPNGNSDATFISVSSDLTRYAQFIPQGSQRGQFVHREGGFIPQG